MSTFNKPMLRNLGIIASRFPKYFSVENEVTFISNSLLFFNNKGLYLLFKQKKNN